MTKKAVVIVLSSALLLIAGAARFLPDEKKVASAASSITIDELRDHLFYLASDELAGRETGMPGYQTAVKYSATQFREAGLKTLAKDSAGKGTFLQEFTLVKTSHGENNSIILTLNGQEETYREGEQYLMFKLGTEGASSGKSTELAFVGYGIEEPDHGWNDYEGLDVKGKIVVVMAGAPMRDGKPILPKEIHEQYVSGQAFGFQNKYDSARKLGAAGFLTIPSLQMMMGWKMLSNMMSRPSIGLPEESVEEEEEESLMVPKVPVLIAHKDLVARLFEGTSYDPLKQQGDYSLGTMEGVTIEVKAEMKTESFDSHNVVGIVPGTDQELKDQYIVIGAHLDHEGVSGGMVFNGADDNGSGSVAVLEAAEAMAMTPARRSVIFVLYSGEEKGLLGSRSFISNCPVPVENIMLNINMDMVGRNNKDFPEGVYAIGSDRRSTELKKILIETDENTVKLPLDFRFDENDPLNLWRRSDHASFADKGIPVICFSSGLHPEYHTPADDAEKINYEKVQGISQLCYELALAIGNRDEKLKIDVE